MEYRAQLNSLWEAAQHDPAKMRELRSFCKDIIVLTREAKPSKQAKPPTAYNTFMKRDMAAVKAGSPGMSHKDVFKLSASRWRTAPENTKNP